MSKVKTAQSVEKAVKVPEKQVASSDAHQPPEDLPLSQGKALRERTPRSGAASYKPVLDRRDPLQILEETSADRVPHLVRFATGGCSCRRLRFIAVAPPLWPLIWRTRPRPVCRAGLRRLSLA